LRYFLGYEVYDRIFTAAHDRNAHWYGAFEVYVPMLVFGALPWSWLAIAAVGGPRAAWRQLRRRVVDHDPDWLLLTCWFVVPLVVFFIARSRLQLYVLPLYVPIALAIARPLARWPVLEGRRAGWIFGVTAVVLVGLKATLAYWPHDRDARRLSEQLDRFVDPRSIDEIVFVNMRPFYGLTVYIDRHIEGIEIGEHRVNYSKSIDREDLCAELAERERALYVIKEPRAAELLEAARQCGGHLRPVARVFANGNHLLFFDATIAPAASNSG
jgi:4-amino-4-deoxy-L-arabinose transferase